MRHDAKPLVGYVSPACAMHEVDPMYMGYWSNAEIAAFLITFLENERAIARTSVLLLGMIDDPALRNSLRQITKTEKQFCRVILREIMIRGGAPTLKTGPLLTRVMQSHTIEGRLVVLKAGCEQGLENLCAALTRIPDQDLHSKLTLLLRARRQILRSMDASHRPPRRDCPDGATPL